MTIQENVSLQNMHTFGLEVNARYFVEANNIADLKEILANSAFKTLPKLLLGGGSNLLFTKDYNGLVIKINIRGIEIVKEDGDHVWVKAGAGENWHQFVLYCIEKGFGGLENLSLIPGTVGAAPMQNIGAYGVEVKDHFEALEAVALTSGTVTYFDNAACEFAYRHSVFKSKLKGQFVIVSVTFRLDKSPDFKITYGAIQETLEKKGKKALSLKAVSDAVVEIRQSKLPDPAQIGNAGSFFKNPTIPTAMFEKLTVNFPGIPGYEQPDNTTKVPAGWLIEKCGWKGKTVGKVGVHENQALVLVNKGGAKGKEVKALAENIQLSVMEKFGIALTPEVNMV